MKRKMVIALVVISIIALLLSCPNGVGANASVKFVATTSEASAASRAPVYTLEDSLIMDSYTVTLYQIEIGNSEEDKQTIWENTEGEALNILNGIDLSVDAEAPSLEVRPGTYQFCRITMGTTITCTGGIDNDADGALGGAPDVTGEASVTGLTGNHTPATALPTGQVQYLFGTSSVSNVTGDFLLANAITVADGSTLTMTFNLAGTAELAGAALTLTAPTLIFSTVQ